MLQERKILGVTRLLDVFAVCSSISLSGQMRHRSCVADGMVLAVIGRCALVARLKVEVRRVKVNFSFDNFEGQDEVSSNPSAF